MTSTLNSHWFEPVYEEIGINLDKLGCIMLDMEPIDVQMKHGIPMNADDLYYTNNPERKWINGWVVGDVAHITLLYGLMENGHTWKKYVDAVLKDWKLDKAEIDHFSYFHSPYQDEEYYCIVAHMKITDKLMEGHDRLQFLPHINTFPGYKAHMTICYIKKDDVLRDNLLAKLTEMWSGKTLKVKPELNYGYLPEANL